MKGVKTGGRETLALYFSESSMFQYFCLSLSPMLVTRPLHFESRFDVPVCYLAQQILMKLPYICILIRTSRACSMEQQYKANDGNKTLIISAFRIETVRTFRPNIIQGANRQLKTYLVVHSLVFFEMYQGHTMN